MYMFFFNNLVKVCEFDFKKNLYALHYGTKGVSIEEMQDISRKCFQVKYKRDDGINPSTLRAIFHQNITTPIDKEFTKSFTYEGTDDELFRIGPSTIKTSFGSGFDT